MQLLTKSKYLYGLQCPGYLWTLFNKPDNIPEVTEQDEARMEQGTQIGELAQSLFPEGIKVPSEPFKENLEKTESLLKEKKPLFEAGFIHNNCFSRADILVPVGNEWDIVEVKSGGSIKEINLHDVSFQKYCYEGKGLKIRNCYLMHLNTKYVKNGEIKPEELFVKEDITEEVNNLMKDIQSNINHMFDIINSNSCPKVQNGECCKLPSESLLGTCWDFLPEDNVFTLYNSNKKSLGLYDQGILSIKDIPDSFKLNAKQLIQKECERNGKDHIDKKGIKEFLDKLTYPLYYLDFETFNTALPMFDNTRPYQQIPFQFSLHIVNENNKIEHHSFLFDGQYDPREEFFLELKRLLGDKGSIIVYNQPFEKMILRELSLIFVKEKKWFENLNNRILDLLIPFRNFSYYNPKQYGSNSIKKVLPVLTGNSYSDMDIGDGGTASFKFMNITFDNVSEEERAKIREDLEKYCCLDTEGMIWIVEKLREMVGF